MNTNVRGAFKRWFAKRFGQSSKGKRSILFRMALVIAILSGAACSYTSPQRSEEKEEPCSLKSGNCSPEEVSSLSQEQLRSVGSSISISCGVTSVDGLTVTRTLCEKRVKSMLMQLSSAWPTFVPYIANIAFTESRTCLDTFVPGREAADCEFFDVNARIPIDWRQ